MLVYNPPTTARPALPEVRRGDRENLRRTVGYGVVLVSKLSI